MVPDMTAKKPGATYFKGPIAERLAFYSIPEPNSGCQIWFGTTTKGYGHVWYKGKPRKAHAVSYELEKGPIPEGMEAHHKCRLKCCINVEHLQPLTRSDHQRIDPRRRIGDVTHCKRGHEFTPENTSINKRTKRRGCRICKAAWQRAYTRRRLEARADLAR